VGFDWLDRLSKINSSVGMQSSLEQQRRFTRHPDRAYFYADKSRQTRGWFVERIL
jgi:isoleucyl-tRNA synthetase